MPKEFGKSIKHVETLKPAELLMFLKSLNNQKEQISITEKIDGSFGKFGIDENGSWYYGTKTQLWTDPEQIPDIFFLEDIKNFARELSKISLPVGPGESMEISGEIVPSWDYNIVIYDESQIGPNGSMVIFEIMSTDASGRQTRLSSKQEIDSFIQRFLSSSPIRFSSTPEVTSNFKVPHQIVIDLEKLVNEHGNVFSTPARTPEQKELKTALLEKVKQMAITAKNAFLDSAQDYEKNSSFGGGTPEGYVFRLPDGSLIKIVDKDKFLNLKKTNWKYMDSITKAERDFKNSIRKNPESLEKALSKFEAEVDAAKADYEQTGQSTITIDRKHKDTLNSFNFSYEKINKMKNLLDQMSPEEVAGKYLNKELVESNMPRLHFENYLEEGGNVFNDTDMVPRASLEPTTKQALKSIGLGSVSFDFVGNVNKDFLGDIDVALSSKDISDVYGFTDQIKEPKDFWKFLEQALSKIGVPYSINPGFSQFHIETKIIPSQDGDKFAQIDFFVGDRGWMKNIVSGSPKDSAYKAIYRNLLLSALVSNLDVGPNKKYVLDFKNGLFLKELDPANKRKVLSKKLMSADANDVAALLFGANWSDISSFEKLWNEFKNSELYQNSEKRNQILQYFKSALAKVKKEEPKEISEQAYPRDRYKVGFYIGSFKPMHGGHFQAAVNAASQVDKLYLISHTGERGVVTPEKTKAYWQQFIRKALPSNVEVILLDKGNVFKVPFEVLVSANEEQDASQEFYIFRGNEEGDRYPINPKVVNSKWKFLADNDLVHFVDTITTKDRISGTKMRNYIESGDKESFLKSLPKPFQNNEQGEQIWNLFAAQ